MNIYCTVLYRTRDCSYFVSYVHVPAKLTVRRSMKRPLPVAEKTNGKASWRLAIKRNELNVMDTRTMRVPDGLHGESGQSSPSQSANSAIAWSLSLLVVVLVVKTIVVTGPGL